MNTTQIDFGTILRISADKREELRPQDVERVMEQADYCAVAEPFMAWLLAAPSFTHGTEAAIRDWRAE